MLNWKAATKDQLLQIAMFEDCENDRKLEAVKELQGRASKGETS